MRRLGLVALTALTALLAACGDAQKPDPAANVQVARPTAPTAAGRTNEAAAAAPGRLGYRELVKHQSSRPETRFSPCTLVTRPQARAILGAPVAVPFEAPQGPTCIFKTESGRSFVTLAVQSLDFAKTKRQIRGRQAVDVAGRAAYCGMHGQPTLYVPLARGRVLSVAGEPCGVARRFASRAVARLDG